jgi:hypothetical protein
VPLLAAWIVYVFVVAALVDGVLSVIARRLRGD